MTFITSGCGLGFIQGFIRVWVVVSRYMYLILLFPPTAEKAEQITYNSLPATITADMWAHQYLQQGNEMNAVFSWDHIWYSDGPDATE